MSCFRNLTLAVYLLVCGPLFAAGIEFQPTIEAARAKEAAAKVEKRRPMMVMFSSPSCVWCRKMEVDTFADERVAKVADSFLWTKVDVEANEELAARYNVRGLPHLLVLDSDDRVIASQPGYVPPERFVAFLKNALENPQPIEDVLPNLLAKLASATESKQRDKAVTGIVERLASADREGRATSLDALATAGPKTWPTLLGLMSDKRLAVRAAAGTALAHATKANASFDPFAPDEQRALQIAKWRELIGKQAPPAERESQ